MAAVRLLHQLRSLHTTSSTPVLARCVGFRPFTAHSVTTKHLHVAHHGTTAAAHLHLSTRFVAAAAEDGVAPAPPKPVYKVRAITKDDVEIAFARSSGAGGQNVNKVNTKVDMRFDVSKAGWIPEEVKDAMRQLEKNRFTSDGILVMQSQRHRTQAQNLDDALAKLQEIIDRAVEYVTPKEADPETIKRVKAQIKAGKERRLDSKKKDSNKKKERSRRDFD